MGVCDALARVTTLHQGIDELAARAGKRRSWAKQNKRTSKSQRPWCALQGAKAERSEAAFSSVIARSKFYVSFACHLMHTNHRRHDEGPSRRRMQTLPCPCVVWLLGRGVSHMGFLAWPAVQAPILELPRHNSEEGRRRHPHV